MSYFPAKGNSNNKVRLLLMTEAIQKSIAKQIH
jgi:hypothetical protein